VRAAKNGKSQVIRTRSLWTQEAEDKFLDVLAATCNVSAAAAEAGFSRVAVYRRRRLWPAFAEAWAAAVGQGYVELEALLVERATASLAGVAVVPEVERAAADDASERDGPVVRLEPVAMTIDQAMALLRQHRAEVRGGKPQRYGWRRRAPDLEEVKASILRKIDAIERGGRS
jgi:hypothetical protein